MIGYLALGSNMGDTLENLKHARESLDREPNIQVLASSSLYETAPYGYTEQADFLNAVLRIETSLSGSELLARTQAIEAKMGRKRLIHWGPRVIDIDILLLGNEKINSEQLHIPHVELTKRSFVLIPLQEVYEGKNVLEKPIAEWIHQSGNQQDVQLSKKEWS